MKNNSLISGSVTKTLLDFTVPVFFALLLQIMYGSVDLLIVGNFAEVADISAVTIGSQIMQLLTSLCTGLAMGTTILLGQKIGEGEKDDAGHVVGNSVIIFVVLSIVIVAFMLVFNKQLIGVMNTPKEAVAPTAAYLFVCTIGVPMIFLYNVLGSIFRGIGDSKTPLLAVGIACVVNIVGDIICVKGFSMGAMGAAVATVVAQTVSVIVSVYIIRKKGRLPFDLNRSCLNIKKFIIKRVLVLGLPIALQSVLVGFSFLIITVIVNGIGNVATAAVGVSEKIINLIMLIPMSFMQSLAVFAAQNFGAKQFKRAKKGMYIGIGISFSIGVIMFFIGSFHGEVLARFFSDSPAVINAAKDYLRSYSIDTMLVAVMFCMMGYFNGIGRTMFVMVQSVAGAIAIRVPLALLFSHITPVSLTRIGFATPLATAIQIIICVVFYICLEKQNKKELLA